MPQLHEFTDAIGRVNTDAAREQAALIGCLYNGDEARFRQIIGPESPLNHLLRFYTTPSTDEIRTAIVEQDDRVFIIFGGTHALAQWRRHLTGVLAEKYGSHETAVHSFHHKVFLRMLQTTLTFFGGTLPDRRYRVSGHSLGGAVAHLFGNHLAQTFPEGDVELMTFGEPRCLLDNYEGPFPNQHWRIVSERDFITHLPPQGSARLIPTTGSGGPFKLFSMVRRPLRGLRVFDRRTYDDWRLWGHYGREVKVFDDGDVTVGPFGDDAPYQGASAQMLPVVLDYHLIPGYLTRLTTEGEKNGQSAQSKAAVLIGQAAYGSPVNPAPDIVATPESYADPAKSNPWLNPDGPGPLDAGNVGRTQLLDIATLGIGLGPSASKGILGGSGMASGIWDIQLVVNNDTFGKTNSVGWNGGTSFESARAAGAQLAAHRAALLGRAVNGAGSGPAKPIGLGTPAIEYLRVRDAKLPRAGQIFELPTGVGQPDAVLSSVDNSADPLWNAMSITIYGECAGPPVTRAKYTLSIFGQPDRAIVGGVADLNIMLGGDAPNKFGDRLKRLLDYLTLTGGNWGMTGQDPTTPRKPITSWAVEAVTNRLVATCPTHGYVTDDRVTISRTKNKYANRVWQVQVIDANSFALRGSQVTALQLPAIGGEARLHTKQNGERQVAFYRFLHPEGGWVAPFNLQVVKRQPGRRITRVSFRPKARRVR